MLKTMAVVVLFLLGLGAQALRAAPPDTPLSPAEWGHYERSQHLKISREALAFSLVEITKIPVERSCTIVRIIERVMARFDADPFIIGGLIIVESRGNPRAVSRVGARGLMQIMPATGKLIAENLGEPWAGTKGLLDMERNITYGTWYYYHLLDQFDGHTNRALAAYNWGPSNIRLREKKQQRQPRIYPGLVLVAEEEMRYVFRKRYSDLLRRRRSRSIDLENPAAGTGSYACSL